MPAIADINSIVTVTPSEEIAVVYGPANCEYIDDRSPFALTVTGVFTQEERIIAVYGRVISGHERYVGLTATLLVRLDNSNWNRDNRSAAQFKVGRSPATPNEKHPFYHPEGTDIVEFPFIMRFGSIDSRVGNEQVINSAMEFNRESSAEPIAPHEPPLRASNSGAPVHRTLDSRSAPASGGGR